MNILINGSPTTLPEPLSLDQMLNRMEDIPQNFAIAVNGLFVVEPDLVFVRFWPYPGLGIPRGLVIHGQG